MKRALLSSLSALVLLGLSAAPASAQESLTVTFDTSATPNPQFGTENIVAVWIEDSLGNYVQTIARYSDNVNHRRYLFDWLTASNRPNDNPVPDGYLGGTFANYQTGLMVTWDLTDPAGNIVPDGTYTIRMELADRNAISAAENNEGTFTFDKNGTSATITGADGGFNNVSIDYVAPDAALCGNGAIDPGETCDDSTGTTCPGTCDETGDVCLSNTLRGDAASCTAECAVVEITQCVSGDGCCPAGCGADDDDCMGANINGGCSSSGSGGGWLVVWLLGALLWRRSRTSRRSSRRS